MPSGKLVTKVLHRDAFPVPDDTNPTGTRCIQILIPDDNQWEETFFSCLTLLAKWNSYQQDGGHLAADVASVWRNVIWNNLSRCNGEPIRINIAELEYEMSVCEQLRFHNGKLQGLCCGEWTDISGQGDLPEGGGSQPGDGTEQPPFGGCATYHSNLLANGRWYLPTVVNTGDVITVSNATGATNDGAALSLWECPDGSLFFAGSCVGGGTFDGADPLVTAQHMELIMNVDGTWVRALSGAYTVPGGVTNGQVYFQVNDSDLTDNAGDYTFDIEVCNNAPAPWSREIDFTLTPGGFAPRGTPTFSAPAGVWTAGVGWVFQDVSDVSLEWYRRIDINRTVVSCNISTVELEMTMTAGGFNALINYCQYATGGINNDSAHITNGTPVILNSAAGAAGTTLLELLGISSAQSSAGALTGNVVLRRAKWTGFGTPPF